MKNSKQKKTTLIILAVIMLVNSLSYGIIIPLLYPYASRFGIDPFGLSLLFASFSIAQFIATPIMGRLSDKYGRKPLLLLCLAGTGVSLALFASAGSALMLFVARILDGITGGNNSIAQAMIADSTDGKDRAKAFGFLGAAFGAGFLLGPALGGLLSVISLSAPFYVASAIALVGTVAGMILLPETLPENNRQSSAKSFLSPKMILKAFAQPLTGVILLISFIFTLALNAWILGFQSFTNDVLSLSAQQIGYLFAMFGFISIIMQGWGIRILLTKVPHKKYILTTSLVGSMLSIFPLYFTSSFIPFAIIMCAFAIISSPINPIITALISERTKAEDQGGILGINQSIVSLGQIAGPLIAGVISKQSVHLIFVAAGLLILPAVIASRWMYIPVKEKVDL